MRHFTVHAPGADPRPETFAFVKEGFSWPALFIPILWILWHRMWVAFLGYIAFVLVVAVVDRFVGDAYAVIVAATGSLLLAFEGNAIRRLSLEARGWHEIGEAFGRNLSEAEIRFFHGRAAQSQRLETARPMQTARPAVQTSAPRDDEPVLGLFPEPER